MNINANPLLERAWAVRGYKGEDWLETFEEAATRHRSAPLCPSCGGKHYAAFLRAIFDDSKKDLPTFSLLHRAYVLERAFKGHRKDLRAEPQDCLRVAPARVRDWVWIDETYINDTDLTHAFGQAPKRGLSKQKLCIAVAIDACKNVVVGHGKPSRVSGIACALTSPRGSTVVGDMEKVAQVPGQGGRRCARGLQGTRQ